MTAVFTDLVYVDGQFGDFHRVSKNLSSKGYYIEDFTSYEAAYTKDFTHSTGHSGVLTLDEVYQEFTAGGYRVVTTEEGQGSNR